VHYTQFINKRGAQVFPAGTPSEAFAVQKKNRQQLFFKSLAAIA